jgi:hypothetical protein
MSALCWYERAGYFITARCCLAVPAAVLWWEGVTSLIGDDFFFAVAAWCVGAYALRPVAWGTARASPARMAPVPHTCRRGWLWRSIVAFMLTGTEFAGFVTWISTKYPARCRWCASCYPECMRKRLSGFYVRGGFYISMGVSGLTLCYVKPLDPDNSAPLSIMAGFIGTAVAGGFFILAHCNGEVSAVTDYNKMNSKAQKGVTAMKAATAAAKDADVLEIVHP